MTIYKFRAGVPSEMAWQNIKAHSWQPAPQSQFRLRGKIVCVGLTASLGTTPLKGGLTLD